MKMRRLVAVGGMALGVTVGLVAPASAASLPGPGSAAQCKSAGGAVVEPESVDQPQENLGIDDEVDVGRCVGGADNGSPIIDPVARSTANADLSSDRHP